MIVERRREEKYTRTAETATTRLTTARSKKGALLFTRSNRMPPVEPMSKIPNPVPHDDQLDSLQGRSG